MVSKRFAKANNRYVKDDDPSKPTTDMQYLDANNLYGWAMSKALPKGGFKWLRPMPTEKRNFKQKRKCKARVDSRGGFRIPHRTTQIP